jgi:hypothetical protein
MVAEIPTPSPNPLADRAALRHGKVMAAAEREGLVLAAKVRLAIILLVLIMQAATTDRYGAAYAYAAAMVLVLGVLSAAHWRAAAHGPRWRPAVYALFALDVACLGIVLAAGNPFAAVRMTPPELFHGEPFYTYKLIP